jgi:hypothetical protein
VPENVEVLENHYSDKSNVYQTSYQNAELIFRGMFPAESKILNNPRLKKTEQQLQIVRAILECIGEIEGLTNSANAHPGNLRYLEALNEGRYDSYYRKAA